jgi:zinc transport system substrate-binding protein
MVVFTAAISGCITTEPDDAEIGAIVSIGPQREMVEAVGGDLVKVTVMVPPGESPHTYSPVPSQMKEVAKAKVYFEVGSGVEFELNHLDTLRSQNKGMKVIDCSDGVTLLDMEGHDHDHEHGEDPHIWLSPVNAVIMVDNIYEGLVKVDPDNEPVYKNNRDAYVASLELLHSELEDRFAPHQNESFLTYHASWGYFAHEYGLEQLVIEEGGKEPGPAGVAAIIEQAKEHNITVVFVSPQFDTSNAEVIAQEIGGKVVHVDPLSGDYISNMREVAAKLEEGLE